MGEVKGLEQMQALVRFLWLSPPFRYTQIPLGNLPYWFFPSIPLVIIEKWGRKGHIFFLLLLILVLVVNKRQGSKREQMRSCREGTVKEKQARLCLPGSGPWYWWPQSAQAWAPTLSHTACQSKQSKFLLYLFKPIITWFIVIWKILRSRKYRWDFTDCWYSTTAKPPFTLCGYRQTCERTGTCQVTVWLSVSSYYCSLSWGGLVLCF